MRHPRATTALAVACLLVASWLPAAAGTGTAAVSDPQAPPPAPSGGAGPACDDVARLAPGADRCAYARAHCSAEGLLNYLTAYYCHVAPHGPLLTALMLAACAALLGLLFRLMGRTADDFFAVILSQISQDLGLPPRLAGVTLLALGNGAPDLSSCVAAVRAGNTRLALGALTGAGMFVGCVVAGRIVTANDGVRARAAQLRDILCFGAATAVVMGTVARGHVGYTGVGVLLSCYGGYVAIVAVADVTKRMGVEWPDLARAFGRRVARRLRGGGLHAPLLGGELEEEAARAGESSSPQHLHHGGGGSGGGGSGRGDAAARALHASASDELELSSTPSRPESPGGAGGRAAPGAAAQQAQQAALRYDELVALPASEYRRRAFADLAASKSFYTRRVTVARVGGGGGGGEEEEEEEEELMDLEQRLYRGGGQGAAAGDAGGGYSYVPPAIDGSGSGGGLPGAGSSTGTLPAAAGAAAGDGLEEGYRGPGPVARAFAAAERPFMSLLRGTVPLIEVNAYARPWFILAMAASPLFILSYLEAFTARAALLALAAGAALAALAAGGTRHLGGKAPVWGLGTGYPIGAALVAVYGFAVAAMWIDRFASEIVGLLHFGGVLAGANPTILGLTVLAWGNSLMDYINNTAMAGRSPGGNSMAMTACYAGPLFNMLLGLGLGFAALLRDSGAAAAAVALDPVVLVGCLFIMVNCLALVAVSAHNNHWLPRWCGWAMVGWYGCYLATVTVVLLATGSDAEAAR